MNINALNSDLERVIRTVAKLQRVVLTSGASPEAADALLPGSTVSFDLKGTDAVGRSWRERGGEVQLIPLREVPEGVIWLGARIEWEKLTKKQFRLRNLSLSFFTGQQRIGYRMRLRAEWHRDDKHPQPHWHFDDEMMFQCVVAGENGGGQTVESQSTIHLPMSGWDNTDSDSSCWSYQRFEQDGLAEWSRRTIEIAISELKYFLKKAGSTFSSE